MKRVLDQSFEIVPIEDVMLEKKESWIQRLRPMAADLLKGYAIKLEATDNREALVIKASWRRVALDRKPHVKTMREEDKIYVYLWLEVFGN